MIPPERDDRRGRGVVEDASRLSRFVEELAIIAFRVAELDEPTLQAGDVVATSLLDHPAPVLLSTFHFPTLVMISKLVDGVRAVIDAEVDVETGAPIARSRFVYLKNRSHLSPRITSRARRGFESS